MIADENWHHWCVDKGDAVETVSHCILRQTDKAIAVMSISSWSSLFHLSITRSEKKYFLRSRQFLFLAIFQEWHHHIKSRLSGEMHLSSRTKNYSRRMIKHASNYLSSIGYNRLPAAAAVFWTSSTGSAISRGRIKPLTRQIQPSFWLYMIKFHKIVWTQTSGEVIGLIRASSVCSYSSVKQWKQWLHFHSFLILKSMMMMTMMMISKQTKLARYRGGSIGGHRGHVPPQTRNNVVILSSVSQPR